MPLSQGFIRCKETAPNFFVSRISLWAQWLAAGGEAKEIARFRERNGGGFVIWSKKK
jgi:hypothetical protein